VPARPPSISLVLDGPAFNQQGVATSRSSKIAEMGSAVSVIGWIKRSRAPQPAGA
jgi:hypothetical protein